MTNYIHKRFYLFYLTGFFLISFLHLLSIPPLFHPASFAKSIVFRIILSLMIFVFVYQNLFLNKESFEKAKTIIKQKGKTFLPLIGLFLLGIIYILSTIFSMEPHFSFWGSPIRGGGSLNILFLIAFCFLSFVIIKAKDWQKLWDFNIAVGVFVSLIAIFQRFEMFSEYLNPDSHRPYSTMGGTAFLAAYLLILFFPTIIFGLKKIRIKSLFYLFSASLFLSAMIISATRAVFLALAIGIIFFLFFYPKKIKFKNLPILKIIVIGLIIISILGAFWLNSQEKIVEKLKQNQVIGTLFQRTWDSITPLLNVKEITFEKVVSSGRYSGWKVLWPALAERPILGYGPENISIPFDKNYDPSIPGITGGSEGGWWDRAHNIFLEKALTIGFPGLIIYLFIFVVLFWQLQKIKKQKPLEALAIQTMFVSYFVANFFSFDTFSTYLILFFVIAYSLFFIKQAENNQEDAQNYTISNNGLGRYILITILIFVLIWFVWVGNIKPLLANKEINNASFAAKTNNCQKALNIMDSLTKNHTFIDNYVRLEYINILTNCIEKNPEKELELAKKAESALQESKDLRPNYTRTWIYSGVYANKIIELDTTLTKEEKQELLQKALHNLEKANELSPKRKEIFLTLIKSYIVVGDNEKALQKAEECLEIDENLGECWWGKSLALINFGEEKSKETIDSIKMAIKKGYGQEANIVIPYLIKMYVSLAKETKNTEHYEILRDLYMEQIKLSPGNFQHHASLAYAYSVLGEYDKAREQAAIVLELSPESRDNVEAFLKTLPPVE